MRRSSRPSRASPTCCATSRGHRDRRQLEGRRLIRPLQPLTPATATAYQIAAAPPAAGIGAANSAEADVGRASPRSHARSFGSLHRAGARSASASRIACRARFRRHADNPIRRGCSRRRSRAGSRPSRDRRSCRTRTSDADNRPGHGVHLMEHLRPALERRGILPAARLRKTPDGLCTHGGTCNRSTKSRLRQGLLLHHPRRRDRALECDPDPGHRETFSGPHAPGVAPRGRRPAPTSRWRIQRGHQFDRAGTLPIHRAYENLPTSIRIGLFSPDPGPSTRDRDPRSRSRSCQSLGTASAPCPPVIPVSRPPRIHLRRAP